MLRYRIALLAGLLVLCVLQSGFAAESSSRWLVSPELLKHANLKILWENELPIKKAENLERLLILGNRIYAISDHNYMVSMNRENGNMIFNKIVAPVGLPIMGLRLYGDELISIGGTNLIQISPGSGTELRIMDVGFGIVCPAARNSSFFYLSGIDKRLHTFRADDRVHIFEASAENESLITSIIADETSVVFATDKGNLISITPNKPTRLWQFDASDAIVGDIVPDGMSLFFASKDTNVYRVDIVGLPQKRQLAWKYQTDGVLEEAPRVTQQVVYQRVPRKGVTAIDKEKGSFLWSVPGGVDLLAEAKGRAYVITKDGKLVVRDNATGKKLYSVNFAGVSRHASNIADAKIYIADKRGRIACLQPVE
jgi:outer membrane protein assembly factor BamB